MATSIRPALSAVRAALAVLTVVGGCALGLQSPASAEVVSARVAVRGMTCNICAGTVERRLKRVACIMTASVDLERGLAHINARAGQHFEGSRILKAIREAGFTPGDIQVVARGQLLSRDGAEFLELAPGELVILTNAAGTTSPLELPANGSLVRVTGRFADPSGNPRASVAIAVEHAVVDSTP
jgi:copper chaperone CopZ